MIHQRLSAVVLLCGSVDSCPLKSVSLLPCDTHSSVICEFTVMVWYVRNVHS